ncbi:hypothetical protein K9L63_02080 [Candidatus Gracilibacteria bacterium]|nr:hypothetical protein [Candidatus Gracilibacteria bacterium]
MKILRVVLDSESRVKDIVAVLDTVKAHKIVFVCPGNFSLLSDMAFLKKLKAHAAETKKELAFVCPKKFIRDAVASQHLTAYSTVIKELEDVEEKTIDEVLQKKEEVSSKETEEPSVPQTKKDKGKPAFSLRKIEGKKGKERSLRGTIFFAFLAVIIILGGVWAWIAPHATIVIKPQTSVLPITQNVLVTFPEARVPEKEMHLPQVQGIFVQTEIAGTEVFPATGRKYDLTNARGKVTLYNETSQPKFLVPSRLKAPNGAIFRFTESVTVPPRNADGAGQLVVDIVADEYDEEDEPIGERGNIEAGTEFIFPALRGALQELYYARANKGPLVGGSTLVHYFVEEESFAVAREVLTDRFRARGVDRLQEEIRSRSNREGKKYVFLDDPRLLVTTLEEALFPMHLIGQATQTFEVQARLLLSGIVFDQTEVTEFLRGKLQLTQDQRKKLIGVDQNSALYRILVHENLEEEKWVKLSVSMDGVEALDMASDSISAREWRSSLRKMIAGKSVHEARGILTNFPEIEQIIDIRIAPFWSENVPIIEDQIEFEVRGAGA